MPTLAELRLPKVRQRARPQRPPSAQQLAYFAALRPYLARMHERVTTELVPLLEEIFPDDHLDVAPLRVREVIEKIAQETVEDMSPRRMRAVAREVATRTSDFQKAQLQSQLVGLIGVAPFIRDAGLAARAERFVAQNTALIRSVPERYFEGVERVVSEGVASGRRAGDMARDIEERFGVAESDAARIANTEVGQFYGELNRTRQEELGVTQFVWDTVQDGRVRDTHREFQGNTYDWDDPPADDSLGGERVIPGQAPNCRCIATPVLPG